MNNEISEIVVTEKSSNYSIPRRKRIGDCAEICVRVGYDTTRDEENDKVRSIQIFRTSSVTVCEYRRGPSGAVTVWTAALSSDPYPTRTRARGYQCVRAAPAGRRYRDTWEIILLCSRALLISFSTDKSSTDFLYRSLSSNGRLELSSRTPSVVLSYFYASVIPWWRFRRLFSTSQRISSSKQGSVSSW